MKPPGVRPPVGSSYNFLAKHLLSPLFSAAEMHLKLSLTANKLRSFLLWRVSPQPVMKATGETAALPECAAIQPQVLVTLEQRGGNVSGV